MDPLGDGGFSPPLIYKIIRLKTVKKLAIKGAFYD
jgi:hypothetical protein